MAMPDRNGNRRISRIGDAIVTARPLTLVRADSLS